jgi:4-carboxymuconolactone decarboxylase
MSDNYEKGKAIFAEVYGESMADSLQAYIDGQSFGHMGAKWAMEWAFGSIWSRDIISKKMRSFSVLSMVIALGQKDEIKFHTKMALANGLTIQEIEEIYYTSIPYCGLPRSNDAKKSILEALAEVTDNSQ